MEIFNELWRDESYIWVIITRQNDKIYVSVDFFKFFGNIFTHSNPPLLGLRGAFEFVRQKVFTLF